MSAILDALRKLQRERERGSQTLRDSLLADPPPPHQSRWVAWVAAGSFVALSGVARAEVGQEAAARAAQVAAVAAHEEVVLPVARSTTPYLWFPHMHLS